MSDKVRNPEDYFGFVEVWKSPSGIINIAQESDLSLVKTYLDTTKNHNNLKTVLVAYARKKQVTNTN